MDWFLDHLWERLRSDIASAAQEIVLVSPYVSLGPVRGTLDLVADKAGVTLVTALDPLALLRGASDLSALQVLADDPLGSVRVVRELHAKAYVIDWRVAWVGSANFTKRGLGIDGEGNLEILGSPRSHVAELSQLVRAILARSHPVGAEDLEWLTTQLSSMPATSQDVNQELTSRFLSRVASQDEPIGFLFQDLPFLESPEELCRCTSSDSDAVHHDRFLFGIDGRDTDRTCLKKCKRQFRRIPIIREVVKLLHEPRRFGEIAAWFHDRCEDRPLPYRSSIKQLVRRTLHWLTTLYPSEFTSRQPKRTTFYGRVEADWQLLA